MSFALPPYALMLGLTTETGAHGIQLRMPFSAEVLGRPGFVQGGAIGGLLEMAALAALVEGLTREGRDAASWKPINITVDYMRGARERDTVAAGRITRLGTRIANVVADAWQEDDPSRLVASARMTMLLRR